MKDLCYILLILFFTISSFAQSNSFIDKRDGKSYKTVKIGNQTWMAENLAFNTDSNCWAYDNDPNNVAKYGYLYNWEAAKSVCPSGWHLPIKEEFKTLCNNFGHSSDEVYKELLPGGRSGFSVQFGGYRNSVLNVVFYFIGKDAIFWSSSPPHKSSYSDEESGESYSLGDDFVWVLDISKLMSTAVMDDYHCHSYGFSVRCLRDVGLNDQKENYDKDSIAANMIKVKTEAKTFIDPRDGKTYKTVKIGNQIWMAENLAFKEGRNCWAYDNDQNLAAKYGYLYSWEVAKSACPVGWHLPSKEDFETLINKYGGSEKPVYKALLPGGRSGFSALFGGSHYSPDTFGLIGEDAYFWSSSPNGNYGSAWFFYLNFTYSIAKMSNTSSWGISVRCIKDN